MVYGLTVQLLPIFMSPPYARMMAPFSTDVCSPIEILPPPASKAAEIAIVQDGWTFIPRAMRDTLFVQNRARFDLRNTHLAIVFIIRPDPASALWVTK